MKLDPGMHIGLHLAFFGKTGVTISFVTKSISGVDPTQRIQVLMLQKGYSRLGGF
jgi:hypothetical protein